MHDVALYCVVLYYICTVLCCDILCFVGPPNVLRLTFIVCVIWTHSPSTVNREGYCTEWEGLQTSIFRTLWCLEFKFLFINFIFFCNPTTRLLEKLPEAGLRPPGNLPHLLAEPLGAELAGQVVEGPRTWQKEKMST